MKMDVAPMISRMRKIKGSGELLKRLKDSINVQSKAVRNLMARKGV